MAEYRVSYDPEARAAYIATGSTSVASTRELLKDRLYLDFDASGSLVGVEVIGIEAGDVQTLLGGLRDALLSSEPALDQVDRHLLAIAR